MKNIGIALVLIGVFIIFYAIFFSAQIFIWGKEVPEIFKEKESLLTEDEIDVEDFEEKILDGELQKEDFLQIGEMMDIKNIIPFNDILNLSALGLFIMLFVYAGFKIAMIGVAIIKN